VRRQDLRALQDDLAMLGLSSLGRMEAHVMATLNAVLGAMQLMAGSDRGAEPSSKRVGFQTGPLLLAEHANRLLGPAPPSRDVRIMVTMPTEAAHDATIISKLLAAGMNVMRINCARDSADEWLEMTRHLDAARHALGRPCRVLADLAGPKLRSGSVEAGPSVVRVKPKRDVRGFVTQNPRIWLTPVDAPEPPTEDVDRTLLLEGDVLTACTPGDRLRLVDSRGRKRTLEITTSSGASCVAECDRTLYVENGTELKLERNGTISWTGIVRRLPQVALPVELLIGDTLILTKDETRGRNALRDSRGRLVAPAEVSCSLPEVFDDARAGEPIWFDDGKIGGRIESNDGERIAVTITHARPGGTKLRADKGINLPETQLNVPAVTARDIECLRTLAPHIHMVGLSFVREPSDVLLLEEHLHALGAEQLGIVLKIETHQAFERLPRLLLAGMRSPSVGVMVARGDLAVEIGYARLAEVQEQILWMCEAAHVPVIWATQVLKDLAKKGIPSRAEVTDAAMSGRAECVMLNKGPFIVNAVEFLSGVLERMAEHQNKKTSRLRQLNVSEML
jgi:pyruvate kinase